MLFPFFKSYKRVKYRWSTPLQRQTADLIIPPRVAPWRWCGARRCVSVLAYSRFPRRSPAADCVSCQSPCTLTPLLICQQVKGSWRHTGSTPTGGEASGLPREAWPRAMSYPHLPTPATNNMKNDWKKFNGKITAIYVYMRKGNHLAYLLNNMKIKYFILLIHYPYQVVMLANINWNCLKTNKMLHCFYVCHTTFNRKIIGRKWTKIR